MIYHGVRPTLKPGVSEQDKQAALESLRNLGREIPFVTSFVIGPTSAGMTSTAPST